MEKYSFVQRLGQGTAYGSPRARFESVFIRGDPLSRFRGMLSKSMMMMMMMMMMMIDGDDDDVFWDDLVPRPIQKPLWTRHTGWCPSSLAKLDTYFH